MHAKAFVILTLSVALISGSVVLGALLKKNTVGGSLPISELTHFELQALAEQSSDPLVTPAIYEQALKACQKAQDHFNEVRTLESYAIFCHKAGDKSKAIDLLRRASAIADTHKEELTRPRYHLVKLLEIDGRMNDAWRVCLEEKQYWKSKNDFERARTLPLLFLIRNKNNRAVEQYHLSLLQEYSDPQFGKEQEKTYCELAELKIKQNDPAQAKRWLMRVPVSFPNYVNGPANQLAWCNARTGNIKEAEKYYVSRLRAVKPFIKLPVFGGIEMDRYEYEYGARRDYAVFMNEIGRKKESAEHEEFYRHFERTYHTDLSSTYSYPRMPCSYAWENQRINWDDYYQHLDKRNNPTNIGDGISFLYGKFIDKEVDLKRAISNAKDPNDRASAYSLLCEHYSNTHNAQKMNETVEIWIKNTQGADKELAYQEWFRLNPDASVKDWYKYSDNSNLLYCDNIYNCINRANHEVVEKLLAERHLERANYLISEELKLYARNVNGNNKVRMTESASCHVFTSYVQLLYKYKYYDAVIKLGKLALEDQRLRCLHTTDYKDEAGNAYPSSVADDLRKFVVLKCISRSYAKLNNFDEAQKWYEKLIPESEYYSDYFDKGGNILQDLEEYADICKRNGQAALLEKAQEHRRTLEAKYKKKKLNGTLSEDTIYRIS